MCYSIRGDYPSVSIDYDPYRAYTPVASHESIRILLSPAVARQYIVEGGDVSVAYLYRKVDCKTYMQ